jgi:uncharacterized protein (DUF427 family)
MARQPIEPGPGQESVWDYPRPPRLEPSSQLIRVEFDGEVVAESRRAFRVLETSHPPVYYIPPEDIRLDLLVHSAKATYCEWKGRAEYYTIDTGRRRSPNAAWSYPEPTPAFEPIAGFVAFYPSRVDACFVEGERVRAQEGDFYGGWITSAIVGPFKGPPGTQGW